MSRATRRLNVKLRVTHGGRGTSGEQPAPVDTGIAWRFHVSHYGYISWRESGPTVPNKGLKLFTVPLPSVNRGSGGKIASNANLAVKGFSPGAARCC